MSKTTPEKHSIPGNDCGRDWRHPKGFCCALGAYSNSNIANKSGVAEQQIGVAGDSVIDFFMAFLKQFSLS